MNLFKRNLWNSVSRAALGVILLLGFCGQRCGAETFENSSRQMAAGNFNLSDISNEVVFINSVNNWGAPVVAGEIYVQDFNTGFSQVLPGVTAIQVNAADINGDGRDEVVFIDNANNLRSYNFATSTFSTHAVGVDVTFQDVTVGQIDGDPQIELLVARNDGGGTMRFYDAVTNTFTSAAGGVAGNNVAANFNNDGLTDFAVRSGANNASGSLFSINNPYGGFASYGGGLNRIATGNLDGAGDTADEVLLTNSAGSIFTHGISGPNSFYVATTGAGTDPTVGHAETFGDGRDLAYVIGGNVIYQATTGWNLGSGGTMTYTALRQTASNNGSAGVAGNSGFFDILAADINGDGLDEILGRKTTDGGSTFFKFENGTASLVQQNVFLKTSDASGTSSFDSAGNWSNAQAPQAGINYDVGDGRTLRTPAASNPAAFVGDSLNIYTGGTLSLDHTGTVAINNLNLDGGTVLNSAGTKTLSGAINLLSDSTFSAAGGSMTVSSTISGTGGLTTTGPGTVILGGTSSNSYSGNTTINAAVTRLGKTSGVAIPGDVTFGNGVSGQPFLRMDADNQFGAGSVMTHANPWGQWTRFDLLGTQQTLAGVNTGSLTALGGGVIQNGGVGEGSPSPATLILNGTGTYVFNGHIRNQDNVASGALNLVKNGTGKQTLASNVITYTGATQVNGGELELLNTTGFNSATIVNSGATLTLSNTANQGNGAGFTIALNNGATLAHNGQTPNSAYLVLNGGVTNSGATTINQSSVTNTTGIFKNLFLDGGLHGSGTVTINAANPGNAVIFRNNNQTFSGKIIVNGIASTTVNAGSGIGVGGATTTFQNTDFEVNGTMELLNQGVGWAASAPGDFWMGALSGNGAVVGNFTGGGETRVRVGYTDNDGTFSGQLANGNGNVIVMTKVGTGTQTFQGAGITYTGQTSVTDGTLILRDTTSGAGGGAQLGFTSAVNVGPSGTLISERTATGIGNRNAILGNNITGSGVININNAANTPGTTNGGWTTVGVANGFTNSGILNINSGVFSRDYTQPNAINSTATVNVAAGAVFGAGRGGNSTIGALNGAGAVGTLWSGGNQGSITIGNGNGSGTFTGVLHGNGTAGGDGNLEGGILNVIKTGSGVQYFDGNSTYSGSTTVQDGFLVISRPLGLGSAVGGTTVQSGATLQLENRGFGNVNVAGESVSIAGNGEFLGQNRGALASWTGNNSWGGSVSMAADSSIFVNADSLTISGALTQTAPNLTMTKIGGGTLVLTGTNTYTGDTIVNGGVLELSGTGSLENAAVSVAGAGSQFLQTSGQNNITGSGTNPHLTVGTGANYTLNGGVLDFQDNLAGAPGNSPSTMLINGTFDFNAGTLIDVATIDPSGGTGLFTQDGGEFIVGRDATGPGPVATNILGGFTQTSGALLLDIFGPTSDDIDMLIADGDVSLGGVLEVDLTTANVQNFVWYNAVKTDGAINFTGQFDGGVWQVINGPNGSVLQVAVPEPASVALWALLAAGIGIYSRRRKTGK